MGDGVWMEFKYFWIVTVCELWRDTPWTIYKLYVVNWTLERICATLQ